MVKVHAVGGRQGYLLVPSFHNFLFCEREFALYLCLHSSPAQDTHEHSPSSLRGKWSSLRANNKAMGGCHGQPSGSPLSTVIYLSK